MTIRDRSLDRLTPMDGRRRPRVRRAAVRTLRPVIGVILAAAVLVPSVRAADLRAEPIKRDKQQLQIFERCSFLNNIFIYGDPTDCPGDETVPLCSSESVVEAAVRFLKRAHPAYRHVEVTAFERVHEANDLRFNPSPLARRYCRAQVTLKNGKHTTAHFFIEEDSGFVGISWSVSVCLDGYDPWRVYDGRCRVARPVTSY